MIYTLKSLEDYRNYIDNKGMTFTENETLANNQWRFDSGTIEVNFVDVGTNEFKLNVPIQNLKRGDKVKITADIKLLGGQSSPTIANRMYKDSYGGSAGTAFYQSTLTKKTDDFETLSLEFTHDGFERGTTNVVNEEDGVTYATLILPGGFGSSRFIFKDFRIETNHNNTGIYPGTKMYYGIITVVNGVPTIANDRASHNYRDLSITTNSDGFTINFVKGFLKPPIVFLNTNATTSANRGVYEFELSTNTTIKADLLLVNRKLGDLENLTSGTPSLYVRFMVIGE